MLKTLLHRRRTRGCPHSRLHGIYGDDIEYRGGHRLECLDCGRLLDGPVLIAGLRKFEAEELALEGYRYTTRWSDA